MSDVLPGLSSQWSRLLSELDDVFQASTAAERAVGLATLLKPLAPAGLTACQLVGSGSPSLAWCAGAWKPPAELERWLSEGLAVLDPAGPGVLRLAELERQAQVRSQAAALTREGRHWGWLVLVQPHDAPAEWLALTDGLLSFLARTVSVELRLQAEIAGHRSCLEQLAETASATLRGDCVLALSHDVNNHLNRMMLQAAVVQLKLNGQLQEELATIRQEVRETAALVRPLQESWQEQKSQSGTVDGNAMLGEIRETEMGEPARIQLDLAADLPPVRAIPGCLRRLLRLLLLASLSRQPAPEPIRVRTWTDNGRARLTIEDSGEQLSERGLTDPFDPAEGAFVRRPLLERLAMQSLLRAVTASLEARPRPGGGLALTIAWN